MLRCVPHRKAVGLFKIRVKWPMRFYPQTQAQLELIWAKSGCSPGQGWWEKSSLIMSSRIYPGFCLLHAQHFEIQITSLPWTLLENYFYPCCNHLICWLQVSNCHRELNFWRNCPIWSNMLFKQCSHLFHKVTCQAELTRSNSIRSLYLKIKH